MRVLILSCSTGGGHNAAGRAMKQALERRGHEAVMLDPYELKSDGLARTVGDVYVKTVQHAPKVFGEVYRLGNLIRRVPGKSPVYFVNGYMAERMYRYLTEGGFDAVLMPHLFPAEIMTYLKRHGKKLPLSVFLATDYACIPFTEETECDYYIIPAKDLETEFSSWGIPREKLVPLGIPVRQECAEPVSRREARDTLGMEENCQYMVLAGGSMGAGDLNGLVSRLAECISERPQWRMIVICGSNRRLREELMRTYGSGGQVELIGYTDQMPLYMRACDLFLTKPGGLTTTEAAAVGTPLVHISPIPGCENKNMEYFYSHGMSMAVRREEDVPAVFAQLEQPQVREAMVQKQKEQIRARSAEEICCFLEEAVRIIH